MEIISGTTDFQSERDTAVAIGKFDGIHIGHRRLLRELLAQKEKGLFSCVFTFDPPPAVLFGRGETGELSTGEEKRRVFDSLGIDLLIEFPLTRESAAMEPEVFVEEILVRRLRAKCIAAGKDLSFGAGGRGDARLLKQLSGRYDYTVRLIDKVCLGEREVSSTYVRELLEAGKMEAVRECLGAPYSFAGRVAHGKRIGRKMGFPTVNLLPEREKLLPPFGVYFAKVLYGGREYAAVTNIGCKPTVTDEKAVGVESCLYGFDGEIYGEDITVQLYEFLRPERRFDSLEELKAQLERDVAAGERYWGGKTCKNKAKNE